MKKRSIILAVLLLLLCLVGCGKQTVIPGRPHALEVTYGERSIHALTGGYAWNWKDGGKVKTVTADAFDPRAYLSKLTYLNTSEGNSMSFDFAIRPDVLTVEVFSAEDGYAAGEIVELNDLTLPAPLDGNDHLYTVTAKWNEDKRGWGSCTYYFRFLARPLTSAAPVINDTGDLNLQQVLTMNANDLWGIEFTNYGADAVKTCLSMKDKALLLQFLKDNIPTDLTPSPSTQMDTIFTMRMVTLTGSQLTLTFGTDGRGACMQAEGVLYSLDPLNMNELWNQLNAGSVSAAAAAEGKTYTEMVETRPTENWGSDYVLGYIRDISAEGITYDEMRQFESQDSPTGFRLEKGWPNLTVAAAENCEFWVMEDNGRTYGKVTAEGLLQWNENAGSDVLYCIYTVNDVVIGVCQAG